MKNPSLCAVLALATTTLIATPVLGQWSSDPAANLPVIAAAGGQELPKVASGPGNTTWISWFDNRGSGYQVYVQRLDAAGNPTFPGDGLLVSAHPQDTSLVDYDLTADAAGNAVLVFTDIRFDSNRDIYAYLISPTGEFLWGADGVALSANSQFEADPRVVQTSDGEYVFLWSRNADPRGLYMQRLDAAGNKLLGDPANGFRVAGDGVEGPGFCEMIASDNGSVIAIWARDTRTFLSPRNLHAQKFDADGAPVWGTSPLIVMNSTVVPIAHRPRIVSDGGAGAVFAWHTSALHSFVQRVSGEGELLFPANGVAVSTNNTDRLHLDPAIAFSPESGSTYVFWNERNAAQSQWGVYGQSISPTGLREWGEAGIEFVPVNGINKLFVRALTVGADAMVFFLYQPSTPLPGSRVLGMRVNAEGGQVWAGSPIEVSSIVTGKGRLPVAIDAATGMAKVVWEDDRNGSTDVYIQNVNADGTLGGSVPACPTDWNDDGQVNSGDISSFLTAWIASVQAPDLVADFNNDGQTNSGDISAFLTAWINAVQFGC